MLKQRVVSDIYTNKKIIQRADQSVSPLFTTIIARYLFLQAHTPVNSETKSQVIKIKGTTVAGQLINIGRIAGIANIELEQVASCVELNANRKKVG